MAETLERSKGLERQFLLSVSHDLRTPLTSIQGYAEAIADGALPDPSDGGAVILSEARRLDRLVDDLLDLAKLESRQFSMSFEPVDLADVVAATVDGFRPEADDASIALELRAPHDPITVEGDTDRLAQVTGNLAAERAEVRALAHRRRGRCRGRMGPSRRHRRRPGHRRRGPAARVRAPLRGAPRSRTAARPGSGLGLAIVRELVTAMRGQVRATAAAGEDGTTPGACLSVFLPFAGPVEPPAQFGADAGGCDDDGAPTSPTPEEVPTARTGVVGGAGRSTHVGVVNDAGCGASAAVACTCTCTRFAPGVLHTSVNARVAAPVGHGRRAAPLTDQPVRARSAARSRWRRARTRTMPPQSTVAVRDANNERRRVVAHRRIGSHRARRARDPRKLLTERSRPRSSPSLRKNTSGSACAYVGGRKARTR